MHADSPTVLAGPPAAAPTAQAERLAEFHGLAGHDGPADGCGVCAAQLERQRASDARLRRHQRDLGQRIDRILGKAAAS